MLIVMAGLPATGKSALAAGLRTPLGAVVLNKDTVRSALFSSTTLDYSPAQDDVAMQAIYAAAAYIRRTFPQQAVILDGRTFLRAHQLEDVFALAASLNETLRIIECRCDDEVARIRLDSDLALGKHPARNRTFALYLKLKSELTLIEAPRLILDTGQLSLKECVERSLVYVSGTRTPD